MARYDEQVDVLVPHNVAPLFAIQKWEWVQ